MKSKNKVIVDISNIIEICSYAVIQNKIKLSFADELNRITNKELRKEREQKLIEKYVETFQYKKDVLNFILVQKIYPLKNLFNLNNEDINICFDSEKNYIKEELYSDYKNRPKTATKDTNKEIRDIFFKLCDALNFKKYKQDMLEGDHLIYLVAEDMKKDENIDKVYIFGNDGDLRQIKIENEKVEFILTIKNQIEIIDKTKAALKFATKLIMGDASDNIKNFRHGDFLDEKIKNIQFGEKTIEKLLLELWDKEQKIPETQLEVLKSVKNIVNSKFSKYQDDLIDLKENINNIFNIVSFTKIPKKYIEIYNKNKTKEPIIIPDLLKGAYLTNYLKQINNHNRNLYLQISNELELPIVSLNKENINTDNLIFIKTMNKIIALDKDEAITLKNNEKIKAKHIMFKESFILENKIEEVIDIINFDENKSKILLEDLVDLLKNENKNTINKLDSTLKEMILKTYSKFFKKSNIEITTIQFLEKLITTKYLNLLEIIDIVKLTKSQLNTINNDTKTIEFFEKHLKKGISIDKLFEEISIKEYNQIIKNDLDNEMTLQKKSTTKTISKNFRN